MQFTLLNCAYPSRLITPRAASSGNARPSAGLATADNSCHLTPAKQHLIPRPLTQRIPVISVSNTSDDVPLMSCGIDHIILSRSNFID